MTPTEYKQYAISRKYYCYAVRDIRSGRYYSHCISYVEGWRSLNHNSRANVNASKFAAAALVINVMGIKRCTNKPMKRKTTKRKPMKRGNKRGGYGSS